MIQIVNTTVSKAARPGITEPTAPTIKLKAIISKAMKEKNPTNLAKMFQRKIKKLIIRIY